MSQHGLAIERWDWKIKSDVRRWLVENFGVEGGRWGEDYDYGLENLWMDEDVYILYVLRWT